MSSVVKLIEDLNPNSDYLKNEYVVLLGLVASSVILFKATTSLVEGKRSTTDA